MNTTTPKKSVHWTLLNYAKSPTSLPSPIFSEGSSISSVVTSTSTLQHLNSQLVAHGFATAPGLSLDGCSNADMDGVVKCLMGMLSQRMEDMSRTEELSTKLRTMSYDHDRLFTMHRAAVEKTANAERETNLHKSKLATATRALAQSEAAHKQTTLELQRTRTSLQALRSQHATALQKRDSEISKITEKWNKLSDSQLRGSSNPHSSMSGSGSGGMRSGMTLVNSGNGEIVEEKFGGKMRRGKGVLECALEEAEEACGRLREENAEVKGLVVDVTNTVQRILQKALGKDPDGEDAPEPVGSLDLFPHPGNIGPSDTAFDKLSSLLTRLRNAIVDLLPDADSPSNNNADTSASTSTTTTLIGDQAGAGNGKFKPCEHGEDIERLKATIEMLRSELDKAHKEQTEYATRAQALFDEFAANPPQLTMLPATATETRELGKGMEELQQGREELEQERLAFTEVAMQVGRERADLEAERLKFLEERRSWQISQLENNHTYNRNHNNNTNNTLASHFPPEHIDTDTDIPEADDRPPSPISSTPSSPPPAPPPKSHNPRKSLSIGITPRKSRSSTSRPIHIHTHVTLRSPAREKARRMSKVRSPVKPGGKGAGLKAALAKSRGAGASGSGGSSSAGASSSKPKETQTQARGVRRSSRRSSRRGSAGSGSGSAGPSVVPSYETELNLPPGAGAGNIGSGMGLGLGHFVLPPPSPQSTLPPSKLLAAVGTTSAATGTDDRGRTRTTSSGGGGNVASQHPGKIVHSRGSGKINVNPEEPSTTPPWGIPSASSSNSEPPAPAPTNHAPGPAPHPDPVKKPQPQPPAAESQPIAGPSNPSNNPFMLLPSQNASNSNPFNPNPSQPKQNASSARPSFPQAKPHAKHMIHAYSPARPSPLSRILLMGNSPENGGPPPLPAPQLALGMLGEEDESMDIEDLMREPDVGVKVPRMQTEMEDDNPMEERARPEQGAKGGAAGPSKVKTTSAAKSNSSLDVPNGKKQAVPSTGAGAGSGLDKGKGKAREMEREKPGTNNGATGSGASTSRKRADAVGKENAVKKKARTGPTTSVVTSTAATSKPSTSATGGRTLRSSTSTTTAKLRSSTSTAVSKTTSGAGGAAGSRTAVKKTSGGPRRVPVDSTEAAPAPSGRTWRG